MGNEMDGAALIVGCSGGGFCPFCCIQALREPVHIRPLLVVCLHSVWTGCCSFDVEMQKMMFQPCISNVHYRVAGGWSIKASGDNITVC